MKKLLLFGALIIGSNLSAQTPGGGVTDVDGNSYNTVIIGDQEWMAENLRTANYNNGDSISNILTDGAWNGAIEGAWCWFNNDIQYEIPHGKLYNYYAVIDSRDLCPSGWRIPSEADFDSLSVFLDPNTNTDTVNAWISATAGGELKQTGTTNWASPNNGANNSTGFNGTGDGGRHEMGWMVDWHTATYYWTTNEHATNPWALNFRLKNDHGQFGKGYNHKVSGATVRCMKDYTSGVGLIELNDEPKNLVKIVDLMGRETVFKPNTVLIYVYDDGSTERVMKLEE